MRRNILLVYFRVDVFTFCTTPKYFKLFNHTFAYLMFYLKIIEIPFTVDFVSFSKAIQYALRKVVFTLYFHKVNISMIHQKNPIIKKLIYVY